MYSSNVAREHGSSIDAVFAHHLETSRRFWKHFGGLPDVRGKRVLDFGCSTGGMMHRLLEAGAAKAIGVDLSDRAGSFARDRLIAAWGDRAEVHIADVRQLEIEPVDLIVSQNTLEHVIELDSVVRSVVDTCKPGGDIYFGFGPLWYSPYGNHWYPQTKLPWYHLLRGDEAVLQSYRERTGRNPRTIEDAGFNKATPGDYLSLFRSLPVEIVSLRRNLTDSPGKGAAMSAMRLASRFPGLQKYLTSSLFVHLKKR